MLIEVTSRSVYGNELIYPANTAAATLAALVGKKTLSIQDLRLAQGLGHTINPAPSFASCDLAEKLAALAMNSNPVARAA